MIGRTPSSTTRDQSLDLLDQNLADVLRHIALRGGGVIDENSARLLVAGRNQYAAPLSNAAMRLSRRADPQEVVADAQRFFEHQGRSFVMWAAAHGDADLASAAVSSGLARLDGVGGGTCMVLREPPAASRLPPRVSLKVVTHRDDALAFSNVLGESFESLGHPRAATQAAFQSPSMLLAPNVRGVLVNLGDTPVSCGLVLCSRAVAGLYFIGTVPSARGCGLGEAVTRATSRIGFSSGASCVVLEATTRAVGLYQRIGFEPISRYDTYGRRPTNQQL